MVHSSWNGMTLTDAERVPVAHAVEVYNHGSEMEVARGDGWAFCDQLLNRGRRVSAFAVDDGHTFDNDFLGGWVYVKSECLQPDALVEALKKGWYYSSQGPLIHDISIFGTQLMVCCSPARNIILSGRGSKSESSCGMGVTQANFNLDRYLDGYVRVTIVDHHGRHAWSNPIWFD